MVQKAFGSVDDAFFYAEEWFKKGGRVIGKALKMTPKQIKRKNELLRNVRRLASGGKYTHSAIQRKRRYLKSFQKPLLEAKIKKLRKVGKRFPHGKAGYF